MKPGPTARILVFLLLAAAVATALVLLPLREALEAILRAVRAMGVWGPLALITVYVVATVLFVPGAVLTVGAGFLFGVPLGVPVVSLASVAGAAAAFWIGRTVARGWIESKVSASRRFRALDQAIGRHGFKIVILLRLSPVFPYALTNYVFAVTRIRFRDFLLASWVGMLPGTVLYVWLGSTLESLAELAGGRYQGNMVQSVFLAVGVPATFAATVFIARLARAALSQAVPLADDRQGIAP
ncbi:MAG TPA: TVP38/TMEM64 family protein [Pirellulales bacterium]|nr:TVP38/TMEM64 family protein [Pirellulales bacterium]